MELNGKQKYLCSRETKTILIILFFFLGTYLSHLGSFSLGYGGNYVLDPLMGLILSLMSIGAGGIVYSRYMMKLDNGRRKPVIPILLKVILIVGIINSFLGFLFLFPIMEIGLKIKVFSKTDITEFRNDVTLEIERHKEEIDNIGGVGLPNWYDPKETHPEHLKEYYEAIKPSYVSIRTGNGNEPYISFNIGGGHLDSIGIIIGSSSFVPDPDAFDSLRKWAEGIYFYTD